MKMFNNICGLYPLDTINIARVVKTKNVCRHCQMSSGGPNRTPHLWEPVFWTMKKYNELTQSTMWLENSNMPETMPVCLSAFCLSVSRTVWKTLPPTCSLPSLCLASMQLTLLWGQMFPSDVTVPLMSLCVLPVQWEPSGALSVSPAPSPIPGHHSYTFCEGVDD